MSSQYVCSVETRARQSSGINSVGAARSRQEGGMPLRCVGLCAGTACVHHILEPQQQLLPCNSQFAGDRKRAIQWPPGPP